MRTIKVISLIIVGVLSPSISATDPNETIRFLANDPATMLDIGLWKISQSFIGQSDDFEIIVDEPPESVQEITIQWDGDVIYDRDDDKIEITGSAEITDVRGITSRETAQNICKTFLTRLSDRFSADHESYRETVMEEYFSHYGFQQGTPPDNMGEEIVDVVRFGVYLRYILRVGQASYNSDPDDPLPPPQSVQRISCVRSMTDDRVYLSENHPFSTR